MIAVLVGIQLLYRLYLNDGGSVDAEETSRVEAMLELSHYRSEQMHLVPHVQPHVISRGFDPLHLGRIDYGEPVVLSDRESYQVSASRFRCHGPRGRIEGNICQEALHPVVPLNHPLSMKGLFCAPESFVESVIRVRLEQIIQGMDLESSQGVFIVGSREDDDRPLFGAERGQHLESVNPRHLHIEKQEIGAQLPYPLHRGGSGGALPQYPNGGAAPE